MLVSLAAPAQAEDPPARVFAAIIDIAPRDGEYAGSYCPPDLGSDEICFGASVLIQRGQIVRQVGSGSDSSDPQLRQAQRHDVDGSYWRFKMIGAHASRRIGPGRYLAILEPTDKDYLFVQWYEPHSGSRACFPKDLVDHYGPRLTIPLGEPRDDGSRCELRRG